MNNVSLITGGTSGIGKAIVLKILKESSSNDTIIVNYGHDSSAISFFKETLPTKQLQKLIFIQADLSSYDAMLVFVAKVKEITPKIDWIVLNVGIGTYAKFEDYDVDTWNNVLNTNVTIPAFLIKELKPIIAEQGNIVFMGSYAGQQPYSSSLVYSVSKAAVIFMAKALVKEFNEKRISINSIAPGFIETRWQKGRNEDSYKRINTKIAQHRFGTPEEVADITYAVLSNDYLCGSTFEVHGGYQYF